MPNPSEWRHSQQRQVTGASYWNRHRRLHGAQTQTDQCSSGSISSGPSTLTESPSPLVTHAEEAPLTLNTSADLCAPDAGQAADTWAQELADVALRQSEPLQSPAARPPLQLGVELGLPPMRQPFW